MVAGFLSGLAIPKRGIFVSYHHAGDLINYSIALRSRNGSYVNKLPNKALQPTPKNGAAELKRYA